MTILELSKTHEEAIQKHITRLRREFTEGKHPEWDDLKGRKLNEITRALARQFARDDIRAMRKKDK